MKPYYERNNKKLWHGDVLDVLRTLPSESVQCVVTSPPYFGLRDYKADGQIGLEPTPEAYVTKLVEVFAEVRRVLRHDGVIWLNLGDSYAGSGKGPSASLNKANGHSQGLHSAFVPTGLKPKDLIGIPWRVAFALQADGWWLRSDIVWNKPNPMPESVTDRPTKSHEYIFLLSKSQTYYYDAEAIKEPSESGPSDVRKMIEQRERIGGSYKIAEDPLLKANAHTNIGQKRAVGDPSGRNRRSVWTIPTQPEKSAHFACYPTKLVEPCVKAGSSEWGCCSACGAPWERQTHTDYREHERWFGNKQDARHSRGGAGQAYREPIATKTTGWRPTCTHDALLRPCVVLDPFAGSGTTLAVARMLGREAWGIELSLDYCKLAVKKLRQDVLPWGVGA